MSFIPVKLCLRLHLLKGINRHIPSAQREGDVCALRSSQRWKLGLFFFVRVNNKDLVVQSFPEFLHSIPNFSFSCLSLSLLLSARCLKTSQGTVDICLDSAITVSPVKCSTPISRSIMRSVQLTLVPCSERHYCQMPYSAGAIFSHCSLLFW